MTGPMTGQGITVTAPDGVPEVRKGDDLAALLLDALNPPAEKSLPSAETSPGDASADGSDASADAGDASALRDGDIVVVTSKVVSKAEGQVREGSRDDALPGETTRVVARRGPTQIVRSRLGLTMAAAGIDASNVEAGHIVRYDPSRNARHEVRDSVPAWLGRKFVYGAGGAELGRRHGASVAPAILSPPMAVAASGLLARRRWSLPVAVLALLWGSRNVEGALRGALGRRRTAVHLAGRGLGWAVRQESALLLRHWWPLALLGCLFSSTARRMVLTALLVDTAVVAHEQISLRPSSLVARRLDDLAYGGGLWLGALRTVNVRCLLPVLVRRRYTGRSARNDPDG